MKPDLLKTESYDYSLDPSLIATQPATPRESARLLVYDRASGKVTHASFENILDFIPPKTHIVINDTRVIKARLFGTKDTGGEVELLLNRPLAENRYEVLIKGKVRKGTKLFFDAALEADVLELQPDGSRIVSFYLNGRAASQQELLDILEAIGHIPLPPYIQREDKKEDEQDYQSVFAKKSGAVAAPTASLHFSEALFKKLSSRFNIDSITLHVGAGTFKPVETENILEHRMHAEWYDIPPKTREVIESDKKILVVGTTATRTIEYFVRTKKPQGLCDLFLHPLNPPQRVNHLLTNFHLPRSTLLMLVASFVGLEKLHELYETAIRERYRFYSYGDAMLIL